MRVMGRRCWGNGSSERGGGPNDFLAGGPEI